MVNRRSLLSACGTLAIGSLSGCLDTFTGGDFSRQSGSADLATKKSQVVERYDEALTERNDGVRVQNEAIQAFNEGDYQRAIGRFETAHGRLETAAAGFSDAAELATEVGNEEAISICETAKEETRLQLRATESGLDAATAANDGEGAGTVNEHVETYRDATDEAESIDVADTQALADVFQDG